MSKYARQSIACAVCGVIIMVPPSRMLRKRYCSKPCASVGQGLRRTVWNKGLTKVDHPSLQNISDTTKKQMADNPERGRGQNHPMYGKKHTSAALEKMRISRKNQPTTGKMLQALDLGRRWCKGLTKHTNPAIARRAKTRSKTLKGTKNPAHSQRMKTFYAQYPKKHPNYILAKNGYETGIERSLRERLSNMGLMFEKQYRVGRLWIDFAFPQAKLAVEADGRYWHDPTRDANRDRQLEQKGWKVLHFSDTQIDRDLPSCLDAIIEALLSRQHGQYPLLIAHPSLAAHP